MKKENYSSAEILNGIRNGDGTIINYVYNKYFDSIRNMVSSKNGSEELAHDVFQEALIVVYKKSLEKDFRINQSSFFTYFYAVCKISLFSIYNRDSKELLIHSVELTEANEIEGDLNETRKLFETGLKEQLFHKYIKKIPKPCFDLLKLVLKGFQSDTIAKKLKMSSAAYVRKKKRICLNTLIEMIKKDPKSNELL